MRGRVALVAAFALLALTPAAQAAVPGAATGGTSAVTQNSAVLHGSVDPNSLPTTWHFVFGPTKAYGAQTPDQTTGATNGSMKVTAAIGGLTPGTTYHYRLVATNASGTKQAGDKTFKTKRPPAAISLSASRTYVVFGGLTVLSGTLTQGPAVGGVKVQLHDGGKAIASTQTDATGRFSFTQSPAHNASFTVTASTNPRATSNAVAVLVGYRVTVRLSTAHPRRGKKVVFSGTVGPVHNGGLVRIQKRVGAGWRTVKSGILGPAIGNAQLSQYRVGVRVRKNGVYRAFVPGDATNAAGASRRRVIRPR